MPSCPPSWIAPSRSACPATTSRKPSKTGCPISSGPEPANLPVLGAARCVLYPGTLTFRIHASIFIDMKDASALFRLLGDEVRLRLLRLLAAERLNVTELTGILGIAQSGVSRHLGMLREHGLVEEQRVGGFSSCRVPPPEARNGHDALWALLGSQFAASADDEVA